ncbi:MAG: hypothetical protein ACRYFZ_07600 [Janthinobacterium lividum]
MLFFLRTCLVSSLLLGFVTGCQSNADEPLPASHCAEAGAAVKSVTDVAGTVRAEFVSRNYAIFADRQGSTSGIDVGVVCDSLPMPFTHIGRKVIFSGVYHQRPGTAAGDTTKYYLTLTKLEAQ